MAGSRAAWLRPGRTAEVAIFLALSNYFSAGCVSFIANGFGMGSSKQPDGRSAMKSTQTQAWGWLAAGVLALGLNGIYQDGGAAWVHRNVDRVMAQIASESGAVLALATGRADWFMAKANLEAARTKTASCRIASA